ncbi:LPXTG cell wall anchor domain-containing protein [Streptomyces laculatispora]|uniref:LPXTG cell wall anchor domain-containing protein n=1 Tax=Streptomyces laculatispora TaxID=887464 RepID=A0ABY9I1L7_9ACTN|nr:LPXTG cell wall anchor domain-containing protein [Streptomyces laculatispora]WLQ40731.1 LPXTG cell wall anchor domain-containing protein [Streptomyces laculatispora]
MAVTVAAVAVMVGAIAPTAAADSLPGGLGPCPGDDCPATWNDPNNGPVVGHDSELSPTPTPTPTPTPSPTDTPGPAPADTPGPSPSETAPGPEPTPTHSWPHRARSGGELPNTGSRGGEWVIGGIAAALLVAGSAAALMARRTRRRG